MKRNLRRDSRRRATRVAKRQIRADRRRNEFRTQYLRTHTFKNVSFGQAGTRVIIEKWSEKQFASEKLFDGMTIKVVADSI